MGYWNVSSNRIKIVFCNCFYSWLYVISILGAIFSAFVASMMQGSYAKSLSSIQCFSNAFFLMIILQWSLIAHERKSTLLAFPYQRASTLWNNALFSIMAFFSLTLEHFSFLDFSFSYGLLGPYLCLPLHCSWHQPHYHFLLDPLPAISCCFQVFLLQYLACNRWKKQSKSFIWGTDSIIVYW